MQCATVRMDAGACAELAHARHASESAQISGSQGVAHPRQELAMFQRFACDAGRCPGAMTPPVARLVIPAAQSCALEN